MHLADPQGPRPNVSRQTYLLSKLRTWGQTGSCRPALLVADFSGAILTFLREEMPRKWHLCCDAVSDNFRVISPKDFRILA